MISSPDGAVTAAPLRTGFRWLQLGMGIVCMAMIANLQYGWTLFVDPIDAAHHWGRAAIQLAFTIFVVTETWLVPVEGWFVDKYGPRLVVLVGGILCAIGWAINAHATTLNGGLESHPPHTHKAEEAMLVMQGTTAGNINGKDYPAGVGEILLLRPDIPHNIKNTGTGQCWYYAMKWYN